MSRWWAGVRSATFGSSPTPGTTSSRWPANRARSSRSAGDLGLDLGRLLSDEHARGRAEATTPALRQALARIVAGEASTLVVARLDSLAGSAAAVGAIMEWLARKDVRFIAADHGLDTATPAGRVAASALSAAGELEHQQAEGVHPAGSRGGA